MEMLLFIGYVDLSIIYIILLLVGMVVCFAFAPVEDKNKPLDRDEISVFKKRAYLILSIEFFHMASSISDFSAHRKKLFLLLCLRNL